ncbi:CC0125/CC1285 family lipoprotein [Phenylobacterium sp.]|uniref:CC0125/CC1285 family lipoprotein n=1 Tax=Phenylobacterium sp. TaxID=1871053 RepID=UPI0039835E9C
MKRLLLTAALCASLGACASAPTVYSAANGPQAVGFSDYRIEPGRYRVTFRGGPGAPPEQVADYALLRAADIALADGYDWFRVSDRTMRQAGANNGPRVSLGTGGGSYGRGGGVGIGLGTSFDLGGGPSLAQTIEVVMGKGEKPPGADVYDARGLRSAIGPRA